MCVLVSIYRGKPFWVFLFSTRTKKTQLGHMSSFAACVQRQHEVLRAAGQRPEGELPVRAAGPAVPQQHAVAGRRGLASGRVPSR